MILTSLPSTRITSHIPTSGFSLYIFVLQRT
ncbi:rCG38141 [Rattus norvegicus]|uniref:RCG38141 n=1 Tax=Rattus norvegicus TaxID=10116 RepID=A6IV27_RAT|nr:rCG38141 [Rattus norvegicus]